MRKIVFVCLGNIIRSAAAEAVLKKMVETSHQAGDFHIESRGCARSQVGAERDPRMVDTARERGYYLEGRSTLVTPKDLSFFDEIYAADRSILERLYAMTVNEEQKKKIVLFTAFSTQYSRQDVPDPYYEGSDGFEIVMDIIEDSCSAILTQEK